MAFQKIDKSRKAFCQTQGLNFNFGKYRLTSHVKMMSEV